MSYEKTYQLNTNIESSDEIVISGIAGRFPNSDNMKQLQENLFNKINLLTNHFRWNTENTELPPRIGTINNMEKFDADFFDVSFKQANTFDPMIRMLLEHTYEAIIDAGINPKQLRGKNTAVVIGTSYLESQEKFLFENVQINDTNIIGCSKSIVANMLSHLFDLKGPSYTIDSACSSSLYAMAVAYEYIISGQCEDAIVGTTHLCLHPSLHLHFFRLGVLSSDGYCRPFDNIASGYSRAETVTVVYLQKAKNAKRIYAICKHIKLNNDGYKEEGITYPSVNMQTALLTEFYNECKVSLSYLDYIEAHGTGTRAGDFQEINAIRNVFCQNRKTPMMVGSVKSNLGHTEAASGFTQIAKVIIAFETGFVPPNINFTSPRTDVNALMDGTIRVVTEALPLKNGYIGVNAFGFGGANAHMLLQWNVKEKINNGAPNDDLPRLVVLSGRTEESVKLFLNDIANHPIDVEYIRLLHDIHTDNIDGHSWRGYIILDTLQKNFIKKVQNYKNIKRPICFIFSALEAQWPEMGKELLKFPAFANAVKRCDTILKPYDISIMDILTKIDKRLNESALHSFVGIIAFQIGLVDLLTCLNIIPDYVIGHFAGELACAYADGCLTMEQTILSAYFIGMTCAKGKSVHSSMITVNLDYNALKSICPADIEIICRNNRNSNIVSGPVKSIQKFIQKLQNIKIDVKEISYNNISYHSNYLAFVETQLLLHLNQIIPQPKQRSSKWISTSIPHNKWFNLVSKLCSASYLTSSILNTVLFEQTTHMIPDNSVIIEIAPNSILQDILKKSVIAKITNIELIKRNEPNTIDLALQGIGELYNCGFQPRIANLYPPVNFPVSRGTPMISPSIRWNQSEDWFVHKYQTQKYIKSRERKVKIMIDDENYSYMTGHVIDGRNLLPATGYLVLVWETIGMMRDKIHTSIQIIFQDIKFIRAIHLSKNNAVNLTIAIQQESGKFEITEGDSTVVTGVVHTTLNAEEEMVPNNLLSVDIDEKEYMNSEDIYKKLKLCGYQYSGEFRGLNSASVSGSKGHITWRGNWVTFMDNMMQMYIIGKDIRNLYVPTNIEKLVINPALHASTLQDVTSEKNKQVPIQIYKEIDVIKSGGIEIRGLKATSISRCKSIRDPVIEEHKFIAHQDCGYISLNEAIRISTQLALENHQISEATTIELVEDADNVMLEDLSSTLLIEAFADVPLIKANVVVLTLPNRFNPAELSSNISIVDLNKSFIGDKALIATGFNLLTKHQNSLEQLLPLLREGGYLLTREKRNINNYDKYLRKYALSVILEKHTDQEIIILLKKKVVIKNIIVVYINNNNFNWLEDLKQLVDDKNKYDENSRIVIVGEGDFECGILGFITCLKKESGGQLVRSMLIQDKHAPKFSLQDPFYMQQLQKDIIVNVLRPNKTWGSYRHLRISHPEVESVPTTYACQTVPGDLSSFCWMENNISVDSNRKDLVRVVYSSINFKDVMQATGKLSFDFTKSGRPQDMKLGLEYVGYDANGQRVMGISENKGIANVVVRDEKLCWNIPDTWTFEEAATVPCIYSTNYYALYYVGKMKKSDKVLIHSGTGGIGQSAIHLALQEGCQVFTTVGTAQKRKVIRKLFPAIPDEHIGNSRDTSFEQMIMRQTNGRGVDIVLNSLAEEKLIASIRCLAKRGRFLEIGKFDIVSNNSLSMFLFQKGISFYSILLDAMFTSNHNKSQLAKLMAAGLKNGNIKPLQSTVFPKSEIEAAFRYMARGKHTGKIILNIQEDGKSLDSPVVAHRCYYCYSDRTYIILGGLGGFGLELTDWLILRGAKNVILTSRTGIKNGYQRMKIELWKSYDVNVQIVKNANLANPEECEHFLQMAEKQAPVDAIFNLALVIKDCIFRNQTVETFTESFIPKAWLTQTLDKLSRKICLKLRHFVVFSSVSCGRGNAGQTNYGMANSIMERVCEKRVEEGLPGLAIQWGLIGDVGFVADMQKEDKELSIGGALQQKISSCLVELEKFLLQNRPIVSSMIVNEKKIGLSELYNVVETIANIMNIKDIKVIGQNISLPELGMDSMMAIEIKQTLERKFNILLTTQEVRNLTFAKLNKISNADINRDETQTKAVTDTNKLDFTKERKLLSLFGVVRNQDFVSEICLDLQTNKTDNSIHVFLLPGLDGCTTVFNKLASRIKFSATSLQYVNIGGASTISEMTDYLLMCILSRLKNKAIIIGYSFGSILAIELMRRLETTGTTESRLVLIDGAPEYLKRIIELYTPSYISDEELQIYIMINIIKTYEIGISEEVLFELKKCETSEERFEVFAKYFLKVSPLLSRSNLQTLYTTVYKNILAIRQYDFSTLPHIKSSITLLKSMLTYAPELEEDYGLYKITENKVVVHYIEGNHITILANEKVAAVINEQTF